MVRAGALLDRGSIFQLQNEALAALLYCLPEPRSEVELISRLCGLNR